MRATLFSIIFAAFLISCGGEPANTNANRANVNNAYNGRPEPAKNPQTSFERALFNVRVESFEQVLVFRRKDAGNFTDEDKQFLRENSPNEKGREVNRWSGCDDGKCFVAGTNFKFTRPHLLALQNRFEVKDYSAGDNAEIILPPEAAETPKN